MSCSSPSPAPLLRWISLRSRSLFAVSWSIFAAVPSPDASSEISESQVALPSFLRLLVEFACQYLIEPSAAIYPYARCPSTTNYPSAAIYPYDGCRSAANYPSAAIDLSACWMFIWLENCILLQVEYCFWWRVLILELATGDGELFWGTEKTLDVLDWCCGLVMWLDLGSWRRDEAGEMLIERWTSLWRVGSNVR